MQRCHGVHFTSFHQNIIPHELCIWNQTSISEHWGFFEVHTIIRWSLTFFHFSISNASIEQNLCNVHIVGKESGFRFVCGKLCSVLLKCLNLPSCINASNGDPNGLQKFLNHPLTQSECPDARKNDCKKPPTPKCPKIVPKRRFHKRKIRTGRWPVQKPIFARFRVESQKYRKNYISSHFSFFFLWKYVQIPT